MCVFFVLYVHLVLPSSLVKLRDKSCADLVLWYNLDGLMWYRNILCLLVLLGILFKFHFILVLVSLAHHVLTKFILYGILYLFDPTYREHVQIKF
jgi:hypothetical protein